MVYPNTKCWIWFPFLRCDTVNWMFNIERDPNVNNAWYCGGILRLCNITSNKRFWSGGNDIDSLCAHQIWNMKHWALAKSTNVGREEPGSHLSGSSSSLSPLLENEMEEINYLNIKHFYPLDSWKLCIGSFEQMFLQRVWQQQWQLSIQKLISFPDCRFVIFIIWVDFSRPQVPGATYRSIMTLQFNLSTFDCQSAVRSPWDAKQ